MAALPLPIVTAAASSESDAAVPLLASSLTQVTSTPSSSRNSGNSISGGGNNGPPNTFASYLLILKRGSDESFIKRKQPELDVLLLQLTVVDYVQLATVTCEVSEKAGYGVQLLHDHWFTHNLIA
jgi:hypothetical protein